MQIITDKISGEELKKMSEKMFENLVKAVVDIEKEIMIVDAALHSDEEQRLLDEGSKQENLWGINLFPDKIGSGDWIEFDSMINFRPSQNNRSRGILDVAIQTKIIFIVNKLVPSAQQKTVNNGAL